jgi:hypothetical protein
MPLRIDQIDTVASEFEGAGTDSRQLSLKAGGITEAKLGFSWEVVEIAASSFTYDGSTRSNYTLATAASSNSNVTDQAALLENGVDNKTLVATTSAENEFSLSGTTLSIHGDVESTGATYKLRYIVGTASGTASSSGNQFWLATVPQQPEQTETDYFPGSALASKWEEWDVPGTLTVSVDNGLVMSRTTDANFGAGIIQPIPSATTFAITAEVEFDTVVGNDSNGGGILVGENLAASGGSPSTGDLWVLQVGWSSGSDRAVFWQKWDDYNGPATTLYTDGLSVEISRILLRLYVDTTADTVQALLSTDGKRWIALDDPVSTSGFTLGSIGLTTIAIGDDTEVYSRMFRVDETSDPYLPVGGYVGTSVPSTFFDRQDVIVTPNGTVNVYGWNDRKAKLISAQAFSVITATVGTYTMALTKDPGGTADNMLSTATFDMTTLTNGVPEDLTLTSTADDLILDANTVWQATFTSDNAGLDAEGVYFMLTWLVL